ncbi:hypothetical protein GOB45_23185 [Sinorhizobium meliloti]|nr:hypothetical protein [Sinorhizobium meliloti]
MCDTIRTLAYSDEAVPHNIDAAGRTADIALKEIIEVTSLQQSVELARYELADVGLCGFNFVEKALSSVDDKKDVFRIPAHEKVAVPRPAKACQAPSQPPRAFPAVDREPVSFAHDPRFEMIGGEADFTLISEPNRVNQSQILIKSLVLQSSFGHAFEKGIDRLTHLSSGSIGPNVVVTATAYQKAFEHRRGKRRWNTAPHRSQLCGKHKPQPMANELEQVSPVWSRSI